MSLKAASTAFAEDRKNENHCIMNQLVCTLPLLFGIAETFDRDCLDIEPHSYQNRVLL